MAERTHIIYTCRAGRRQYLVDIDQTGMARTTTERDQAIALSMLGAVAIAKELDQDGGWRWHVEAKNRNN